MRAYDASMTREPEGTIYSTTGHLARELGVSVGMAARYGRVLERVRGEPLQQAPGRGRKYSAEDVAVLRSAREQLRQHPQRTIDEAIRRELGLPLDAGQLSLRPARATVDAMMIAELAAAVRDLQEQMRTAALPAPADPRFPDGGERLLDLYRERCGELEREVERLRARRPWAFWRRD